jgi:hypothetical protein
MKLAVVGTKNDCAGEGQKFTCLSYENSTAAVLFVLHDMFV